MEFIHVSVSPGFKKGDQPPVLYGQWHEWAAVQHRAGLRQAKCDHCGKWLFPQEKCESCPPTAKRNSAAEWRKIEAEIIRQTKAMYGRCAR